MSGPSRRAFRMIAMYAAVLAAFHPLVVESATRRRVLGVLHSDEYTESVLTIKSSDALVGFNAQEHAKIASMLDTTKEMMDTANALIQQESTKNEGRKMMEEATTIFHEVKSHLRQKLPNSDPTATKREVNRELLRQKYSNHDVQMAAEDEERGLDVSRRIYETVSKFDIPLLLCMLFANRC